MILSKARLVKTRCIFWRSIGVCMPTSAKRHFYLRQKPVAKASLSTWTKTLRNLGYSTACTPSAVSLLSLTIKTLAETQVSSNFSRSKNPLPNSFSGSWSKNHSLEACSQSRMRGSLLKTIRWIGSSLAEWRKTCKQSSKQRPKTRQSSYSQSRTGSKSKTQSKTVPNKTIMVCPRPPSCCSSKSCHLWQMHRLPPRSQPRLLTSTRTSSAAFHSRSRSFRCPLPKQQAPHYSMKAVLLISKLRLVLVFYNNSIRTIQTMLSGKANQHFHPKVQRLSELLRRTKEGRAWRATTLCWKNRCFLIGNLIWMSSLNQGLISQQTLRKTLKTRLSSRCLTRAACQETRWPSRSLALMSIGKVL